MPRFILRRLGLMLITLVLVSMTVFAAGEVLPGDVGRTILGPYASNAQVAALDKQLGQDKPLPQRYWEWATNFVKGDWGTSPVQNVPVRPLVLHAFRNSLYLAVYAFILIVPLSIALGVIAGLNDGKALDRVISIGGLSFIALPEFVMGVILIVVFAVQLGWFPPVSTVPSSDPVDWVRQLTLPAIPLMFVLFGYVSQMARAGTIESMRSPYIRTAILKGLPTRTVVWRHLLRNSLLPTITVVAVQIGYLVGGLVVIETLFTYPGIGQLTLTAANGHDLPTLEASVLVIAIVIMLANLTADVLYAVLNPRVRLAT